MRSLGASAALLCLVTTSGCGYIHFGRLPVDRRGDAALEQAYSDLALEHKILKQELALAHKENDSLRAALERSGAAAGPATDLTHDLERTAQELATVRANYAKLQAERTAAAASAASQATADSAALRQENVRLQRELEASRQENATLAEKLKTSVAEAQTAQASLAQLNTALLDEKQARNRAEQATTALRAQLEAVMARASRMDETAGTTAPPPTEAAAIGPPPNPLAALQDAKAPPSGAAPLVEIRTSPERARGAAGAPSATSAASIQASAAPAPSAAGAQSTAVSNPTPKATRMYTVRAGDTLEKIAASVYGSAAEWGKIYAANAQALGAGNGLRPGMKLEIPEP